MSDSSSDRPEAFLSETVRGDLPPSPRSREPAAHFSGTRPLSATPSVAAPRRSDRLGGTTLPARPHACRRYLKVRVRDVTYGIPASQVREIVYCPEISEAIAQGPRACAMANLRGHIVPVVDGARLVLGDDQCRADLSPNCLVVLEMSSGGGAQRVIGLLVDGIDEVVQLREERACAEAGDREKSKEDLRSLEPLLRDFLSA